MHRGILGLMIMSTVLSAQARASGLEGAWRGNWTIERPDGRPAEVFTRVAFERKGDTLSARLDFSPFGAASELRDIAESDGRASFSFEFRGQPASFAGNLRGSSLAGTVRSVLGETPLALERIIMPDEAMVAALLGVYRREDGREFLVSPERFVLSVYDLESGEYDAFFPRDSVTYFAGRGYRLLTPVRTVLRVLRGRGGPRLEFETGGRRLRARRLDEVRFEDVEVRSDDVTLSGTIVRPAGTKGAVPAVVAAVGSGRQTRWGAKGLNAYRAAWLARHGVAVLVHDKRGVGKSTGKHEGSTHEEWSTDLAALADDLAGRPGVDPARVGIMVHSQSGIFAPSIIRKAKRVSFAVVLSTTVVNGEIQEIVRTQQQLEADGFSPEDVRDAVATQILKFYYANHRIGWDAYVAAYHRVKERVWFEDIVGSTIDPKRHSWDFWRTGNSYEPSVEWRGINVPVLFFFGGLDRLSPIEESVRLIEAAFSGERRRLLTVERLPGATHDLFLGETGGLYDEIRDHQMSDFLPRTLAWLERAAWTPGPP